jgi:hypothetical protein
LVVVALFLAFLLFKVWFGLLPANASRAEAKKRIAEAKRRARQAGKDRNARATAWREAARVALDELERPSLAGSYAQRAVRAQPDDVHAIALLSEALRTAGRYRTLDRLLWRRLRGKPGPGYDRAFEELLALYEGPMRRREQAQALRAMRRRSASP